MKIPLKSALLRRKLLLPSLAHMSSFELPFTRRRFLLLLLFGLPALALPL